MLADALAWLKNNRKCSVLAIERSPWDDVRYRPDVIGVSPGRKCIEIEIKRSLADFKQDTRKSVWRHRYNFKTAWPDQFYFFTPPTLVQRVLPLLPAGLGLLTWNEPGVFVENVREIFVVRPAAKQASARKLTIDQYIRMVINQTGSLVTLSNKLAKRELTMVVASQSSATPCVTRSRNN